MMLLILLRKSRFDRDQGRGLPPFRGVVCMCKLGYLIYDIKSVELFMLYVSL
jgi:hypothetical protein